MRIGHLLSAVVALMACELCYLAGFRAGTRQSPQSAARQGDLVIALRTYQAAERTNWTEVQNTLGMQVLALTRDYERRFGVPSDTNRFAQYFTEAKAIADQVESQLVPMSSAFTNLPLAPNFKLTVGKEK